MSILMMRKILTDMMESSGMKGYHCGATSRGVDTVQVGHINKSSAPCNPESQKLIICRQISTLAQAGINTGATAKLTKTGFHLWLAGLNSTKFSPSLSLPINDKMIIFSSNNFADSWHLWGMDWKVDVIPSITLQTQLSEENGVFKKLSHTNGSLKSAQIVFNQKVGPIGIRVGLDDHPRVAFGIFKY